MRPKYWIGIFSSSFLSSLLFLFILIHISNSQAIPQIILARQHQIEPEVQQQQAVSQRQSVVGSHGIARPSVRCYTCSWSITHCADFNCFNNQDTCTNNNFNRHSVHRSECPAGCEQFVITDPNGIVQQWRRNCAPGTVYLQTGFNCRTEYQLGFRVDRCFCNQDWCNASSRMAISVTLFMSTLIMAIIIGVLS